MKNENVLKLTQKIADEMMSKFTSADFQAIIKSLKEVSADTGTFEMVISTDDTDRHGEIVDQKGIDFTNYMKNPVVLWGHNHNQIPVGITDEVYMRTVGNQIQTVAKGRFASHEFAQTLRQLYDAGMIKTSSIGFIPFEYVGNVITKSELLEWSFVSIPANPYALALGKSGFNVEELIAKGVFTEEVKTGDDVETTETVETPVVEDPKPEETIVDEPKIDEPVIDEPVVEPTAPVQEEKGAIADEIIEEDTYAMKRTNFDKIAKLFYAFAEVYFDEETLVEDFETLKGEFISLLQGELPNSRLVTDKSMDDMKAKYLKDEKAGRVLSSANREKINNAILALEEVLTADTPEEKSVVINTDGVQKESTEVEAIEDFLTLRKSVQNMTGIFQQMLKDAKVTASKYGEVRDAN